MADWVQLISELSLQKDKLAALASSQNNTGWRQELDKAEKLKVRSLPQLAIILNSMVGAGENGF